ncbi:MAG: hypothetical protein ABI137_12155 [Antricoccus sp.]
MSLSLNTAFGPCGLRADRGALIAGVSLAPAVMRLPWSAIMRQVRDDRTNFTALQCRIDLAMGVATLSLLVRHERWAGRQAEPTDQAPPIQAGLERLSAMLVRRKLNPRLLTGQQLVALDGAIEAATSQRARPPAVYLMAPLRDDPDTIAVLVAACGASARATISITATIADRSDRPRLTAYFPAKSDVARIERLLPDSRWSANSAGWDRLRAFGGGPAAPELALVRIRSRWSRRA